MHDRIKLRKSSLAMLQMLSKHVWIELLLVNSVKRVFVPLKELANAEVRMGCPGKDNSVLSLFGNSRRI